MSKDGKMIEQIRKNTISINKLNEFMNLHNERMVKGLKKANNIENNQSQEEKDIKRNITNNLEIGMVSIWDESRELADKIGSEMKLELTNEWKDLDINNLTTFPKDFFTNTNIEIEISDGGEFKPSLNKLEHRIVIIQNMKATDWEYRYRLKPLETVKPKRIMKVTQRIYDMFYHELIIGTAYIGYKSHMDGENMIIDNCKVELL